MQIEIFTDGSATTKDKPGGYAWVMVIDGQKHSEGSGYLEKATNNDAELEAAIEGLKVVQNYLSSTDYIFDSWRILGSAIPVTLVSDSEIVLGWASGRYQFKQQDKIEKFKQLQLLISLLGAKTRWVEGHSGNEFNERCDKLANAARLSRTEVEVSAKKKTKIGIQTKGVTSVWYKNNLKIIDLERNIVEDYDASLHGERTSQLEFK